MGDGGGGGKWSVTQKAQLIQLPDCTDSYTLKISSHRERLKIHGKGLG